ncbi:DUF6708 domain-containing protein [Caballeronia sp. GAFFF1]|uniref:DUF6708 domain-containing protein n=1 Tax=Caballeronia sp. GAFFF1 TaxID=2921779 RepID=UPI0020298705|nr:DUF6708 domain-containing protein [Caballeronia sp. GAFFF1]
MPNPLPLLNPPARGWRRDLPAPDAPLQATPSLSFTAPNHVDEIYLELSRSYLDMRGLVFWLSFVGFACTACMVFLACTISGDLSATMMAIGCSLLGVWTGLFAFRMDVSPPRDLPIRFNRQRRKMYVYEFEPIWWNPFTRWPVRAVAYDWDDVRAEAWSQGGATSGGVYFTKSGVVLSVVRPGTNEVIDRFQLRAKSADERAWAYICTYMQKGPQALPPSKWQPRDWNNEPTANLARLLAPRVKWPAEMDIESRTAPSQHNCRDFEERAVVRNISVQGE